MENIELMEIIRTFVITKDIFIEAIKIDEDWSEDYKFKLIDLIRNNSEINSVCFKICIGCGIDLDNGSFWINYVHES